MPLKPDQILQKIKKNLEAVWRHLGLLKYVLVAFVLTILAVVISFAIWARIKPIAEYNEQFEAYTKKTLSADELSFEGLHWSFDWKSMSLGLGAQNFYFKDESTKAELSSPKVSVHWSPLHVLMGTFSFDVMFDQSTWQMNKAEQSAGLNFKGLKKPGFWEKRIDVHVHAKNATISINLPRQNLLFLDRVEFNAGLYGTRSHFDGKIVSKVKKGSELGQLSGDLNFGWSGVFQYVDSNLVGLNLDKVNVDFSKSTIQGWGLYKIESDPLHAHFGLQVLVGEDGELSTFDVKGGKLKFADLNFNFDGDQKNASGSAFKWILENQQLKKNKLPFAILHQAEVSGPVQAEGRIALTKSWDFSSFWSLRANGMNFSSTDLKDQFDPRSEGSIFFNIAFDGGFEEEKLFSSGLQIKIDAKDAFLISKKKFFIKPKNQSAQLQILADIVDDKVQLKPSFVEWVDFRLDFKGHLEELSAYLFRNSESSYHLEAHTGRVDISRVSHLLGFLKQNPVPNGILEFAGAVSGTVGGKSFREQMESKEVAWRVDQFSLSHLMLGLDTNAVESLGNSSNQFSFDGTLSGDINFKARGRGYSIESSFVQAGLDLTNSEFVVADEFRKNNGVRSLLNFGVVSVPNKVEFKPSSISLLDNEIQFSGILNQGLNSRISLNFAKSLDLVAWRSFFRQSEDSPLSGTIQPNLFLNLLTTSDQMDKGIDWRRVGITGNVDFKNLNGLRGGLRFFDRSQGVATLSRGQISIKNFKKVLSSGVINGEGSFKPIGQKSELSFFDIGNAKGWDVVAKIHSPKLDVIKFVEDISPNSAPKLESSPNSMDPRDWFSHKTIKALMDSNLLKFSHVKANVTSEQLIAGPWRLGGFSGDLDALDSKLKFRIKNALLGGGASLSGAGVVDYGPRWTQKNLSSIDGTWSWQKAPLNEILKNWDIKDSGVFTGSFSGEQIYSLEKSLETSIKDEFKMNFDGKVYNANHGVLAAVDKHIQKFLSEYEVRDAAKCFSKSWSGVFKGYSHGKESLHIEEANWDSSGSSLVFRSEAQLPGGYLGEWSPRLGCLGVDLARCWSDQSKKNASLGKFKISGPWDRLKVAWESEDFVTRLKGCVSKGLSQSSSAGEPKVQQDPKNLKDYLKKNAN